MDIIKPSFTIFEKPDSSNVLDVMKYIERIGRICYKSEAKITDDSCRRFINNLRENKHWAMLEHYIFVFEIPEWMALELINKDVEQRTDVFADYVEKLNYIRVNKTDKEDFENIPDPDYILSASATALNYLWETYPVKMNKNHPIARICRFMYDWFQPLMKVPSEINYEPWGDTEGIRLLSNEEISNLTPENRMLHDWISVDFITDRGVSHEIVRHRPFSFAQESTRYCSYKGGLNVINPSYFEPEERSELYLEWNRAMRDAEAHYNKLLQLGAKPQEARAVLPNSTKTEIVVTGRFNEWIHFFKMRADKAAHPQMQELAYPLKEEFIKRWPEVFANDEE